jgi:hypothetical protein
VNPPSKLFAFPDPVDEVSARLVALGALSLASLTIATGAWWLVLPLAYGFVARVVAGPRFSPLGLLVTRVIRPRLRLAPRLVPGPPKRFAQGVGVVFTTSAALLALGFQQTDAARVVLGLLVVAASLEAFLGFCLGCKVFALLMRLGVIPPEVCERCNDLWATRS